MTQFKCEDGSHLYYEVNGSGRPVVFVHAWATSGRMWEGQVAHLRKDRRVVSYDQRGHGRSDAPDSAYSMDVLTHDLRQLIRHLDLKDVTLIGWSMGVTVALNYMRDNRDKRVSKLGLISGSPYLTKTPEWEHGFDLPALAGLSAAMEMDRAATTEQFYGSMLHKGHSRALLDRLVRESLSVPYFAAMESLQSEIGTDLRSVLPTIDVPTLIVYGEADHPVCPGAAEYMKTHIPRATIETIPTCGHFSPVENAPALNAILERFTRA